MIAADNETLAAIFASRVKLAKKTADEVVADALEDFQNTLRWIKSNSEKESSFLWFCDLWDLDAGAVRKAIQEKVK